MTSITKFFLFDFFVTLLGGIVICEREMSFELMPKVLSVAEVSSSRNRKIEDAPTESDKDVHTSPVVDADELKTICAKGVEMVSDQVTKEIKFSNELTYGEQKRYVVESIRVGYGFSIQVVTGFKCPTEPAMYVTVEIADEQTGKWRVLVICKNRVHQTKLRSIKTFAITFVKNIEETYSDEIRKDRSSSESAGPSRSIDENNPRSLELDEDAGNADEEAGNADEEAGNADEDDTKSAYIAANDSAVSLESSLIDIDDLREYERLEMCRRATYILSDTDIQLREGEKTGPSKYYTLNIKREIIRSDSDESRRVIDDSRTNIAQAFKCPSTLEDVYLSVDEDYDDDYSSEEEYDDYSEEEEDDDRNEKEDDDDDDEQEYEEQSVLWVIVPDGKWSPLFEILKYRLKFYKKITPVTDDYLADRGREAEEMTSLIRYFPFDIDELGERSRRVMCEKAILTTLQTGVKLEENVEIEQTEFYEFKYGRRLMVVQALRCPTNRSIPVYVHVGKNRTTNERFSQVYVNYKEKNNNQLLPWVEHE